MERLRGDATSVVLARRLTALKVALLVDVNVCNRMKPSPKGCPLGSPAQLLSCARPPAPPPQPRRPLGRPLSCSRPAAPPPPAARKQPEPLPGWAGASGWACESFPLLRQTHPPPPPPQQQQQPQAAPLQPALQPPPRSPPLPSLLPPRTAPAPQSAPPKGTRPPRQMPPCRRGRRQRCGGAGSWAGRHATARAATCRFPGLDTWTAMGRNGKRKEAGQG